MSRRRSNGIVSFFDGFNQGYQTVGRVLQDRELRRIASEAPIESQGYTADQGDELRRAAESGQYDIGIKTKEDGTFDSYTVTLKADPSQTRTIAMQGVTDFLGERRAGSMTPSQVDRARTMAQAGVLAKFGNPIEAQRLRQQAAQSEQMEKQGVLTDIQIGRARREEEEATKLTEVNDAVANYMKSRVRLGEDGQPMPLTDDDFVMAGKYRVFELANRGLFDQAMAAARESMDYVTRKIQAETTQRQADVRDAVARIAQGDYAQAMAVFNKYVPDGNIVQNVIQNRDGSLTLERISGVDGKKLPSVRVESLDKLVAAVQSIADPNALTQYIERTFRNDIETRRMRLSENADRRAGATFAQGQADRKAAEEEREAQRQASYNLWLEQNPNATEAQKAAARLQILRPHTGEGGEITSDYKPDAVGMGGTAIQKDKAGNLVVTKIGPDGKVGQPMVIRPPGSDSTPKFASMEEAEAAVKAGKIKPGDRVTIGGRTAVWMPDAAAPAPAPAPARTSPASQPVASPAPVAQTPPSAPPQAAAPRSVASVLGVGKTKDSALNAILANKAKAIESAASDLKTAQAQFVAVARSGDKAAMAEYQRRLVAAQQRLNAMLGSMNEAQAAQVRRALGI